MPLLWVDSAPLFPGGHSAFGALQFVGRPAGGTYTSSRSPGNGPRPSKIPLAATADIKSQTNRPAASARCSLLAQLHDASLSFGHPLRTLRDTSPPLSIPLCTWEHGVGAEDRPTPRHSACCSRLASGNTRQVGRLAMRVSYWKAKDFRNRGY